MAAQEVKKDLQVLVAEDVKKMETLETKDLPALEKALKDYHVACMEVKDVGNKLGAELRRLGEIVPDNEWAACLARVGDVQHFYENIFGDCVEKVLLDGVIEPLKKYAKEESNVAGEHIRKSRAATKAFDELTQKRTAQSLAKKTTTSDMLTILRAEKQEAELKTAMLHFLKAYDSHRCYKLISLINDFMRGQLTYHEAIQQKHRELVVAWKPIVDKKLSDFDVPRDPEDRIEKKGGVEAVHNMQAATRVATTVKNLLPAQYGAALRPSVSRQSLNASTQSPVVTGPPVAKQQVGTMSKKTEIAVMSQPVKPDASATPNAFKTKEAVRGALMALQSHLTELSPSQISMEITRILLLLDDTYIPPTNSSLSSPNLHPGPAPGQPVPAGAALASTHSAPGPSPYIQPKSHSSMQPGKRLSVGSLSEFIEEKPPAKPAPADRVNSSIDEILAGFLDNTKAEGKPAAAPPPAVARPASTANITDELMALITQNNPSPKGSLVAK